MFNLELFELEFIQFQFFSNEIGLIISKFVELNILKFGKIRIFKLFIFLIVGFTASCLQQVIFKYKIYFHSISNFNFHKF